MLINRKMPAVQSTENCFFVHVIYVFIFCQVSSEVCGRGQVRREALPRGRRVNHHPERQEGNHLRSGRAPGGGRHEQEDGTRV